MRTITANCFTGSGKKRNLQPFSFAIVLCFSIALFYNSAVQAQIPAQCGSPGCTSNDVRITNASITDEVGSYFVCSGTDFVDNAWLHLFVTTNTKRVGVFVSLTVNVVSGGDTTRTNVYHCFTGANLNGANNDLKVLLPNNLFRCGSKVFLTTIYTAWGTGTSDFCGGSEGIVCQSTPSKCRFVPGEVLQVQTTPCSQPNITANPSNTEKCAGTQATFTAKYIQESAPIVTTYKWQVCTDGSCATEAAWSNLTVNGSPYDTSSTISSNERTATLTINGSGVTSTLNGNRYRLFVSNVSSQEPTKPPCTLASSAGTLTVDVQPSITGHPSNSTKCAGSSTSFTVAYTDGSPAATIQWQINNGGTWTNLTNTSPYSGVTSATLGISNVTGLDGKQYKAVLTSGQCSGINSNAATLTVNTAPSITTQPSGLTKCAGQSASFTVAYSGGSPAPSVKWQVSTGGSWTDLTNTSPYSGVTTTTLSISSVSGLNGNQYRAVLSSGQCSDVNSNAATLNVDQPPTSATVGSNQNICASLVSTALGGNSPSTGTGTWTKKSGPGSVTFSDIHSGSATATVSVVGTYVFTWTIANGTCNSSAADITVVYNQSLSAPGVNYTAPACDETTFSITVSGLQSGDIVTVLNKNGGAISGMTPASGYTVVSGDNGSKTFSGIPAGSGYQVTFTRNGCTSATAGCPSVSAGRTSKQSAETVQLATSSDPMVKAYPNPFNDRVKFVVNAPSAGNGSLEVYNIMGQKIKTVYQGHINAGDQSFELTIPKKQQATLIYIFRVGDKKVTGKLLQLNN